MAHVEQATEYKRKQASGDGPTPSAGSLRSWGWYRPGMGGRRLAILHDLFDAVGGEPCPGRTLQGAGCKGRLILGLDVVGERANGVGEIVVRADLVKGRLPKGFALQARTAFFLRSRHPPSKAAEVAMFGLA